MAREMEIVDLQFDEHFWPRVRRDEDRIAHLADVLTAGGRLPAIKVQSRSGLVLGGWHTVAAYQRLQRDRVPVEIVDVPEADRLMYAYREDAEAALPYTAADVRSVARRLYQQRSNGRGANVAELARDLGRAQPTVLNWVKDLVAAESEREVLTRQARAVAAHALVTGATCSQRRAGELLGVSEGSVRSDIKLNITTHIADERVIDLARSLVAETAGRGSTPAERQQGHDWLLEQTDPTALQRAQQIRALNNALDWTLTAFLQLEGLDTTALGGTAQSPDPTIREKQQQLLCRLRDIQSILGYIEGRTA